MKREMRHEIRASKEFKDAICELYTPTRSCSEVAKRVSLRYGFDVSPDYISKVLQERNIRVRGNGRRTYSIYDAQLGKL